MSSSEIELPLDGRELEAFDVTGAFLVSLKMTQQELEHVCRDTVTELRRRSFQGAFSGYTWDWNIVPGKHFWNSTKKEVALTKIVLWRLTRDYYLTGTAEIATMNTGFAYKYGGIGTVVDIINFNTLNGIDKLKRLQVAANELLKN